MVFAGVAAPAALALSRTIASTLQRRRLCSFIENDSTQSSVCVTRRENTFSGASLPQALPLARLLQLANLRKCPIRFRV